MKPKQYHGVVIPMATPVTEHGDLDKDSIERLLAHITEAGTFPFVLGTNGESQSLALEKRLELVKYVSRLLKGRTTLYAGISDNAFEHSMRAADAFATWGVDVLVAHLPSYYPVRNEHIINYYTRLADRSPLPVMVYNIPSTTHVSIPLDIIERLSAHSNICGLKDSERSLERMDKLAKTYTGREDFTIMSGWTAKSAYALISGFDGIVPSTGNVVPALFNALYESVLAGDTEKALNLQAEIDPWADLHQKDKMLCDMFPALKIMLNEKALCGTDVLSPLMKLTADEEQRIRGLMRDLLKDAGN